MNNLKKVVFVATATSLIDDVVADSDSHHSEQEIPDEYDMDWTYDADKEEVSFNLKIVPNTWMGFALGAHGMEKGADMIMCGVSAEKVASCLDMESIGEEMPKTDAL